MKNIRIFLVSALIAVGLVGLLHGMETDIRPAGVTEQRALATLVAGIRTAQISQAFEPQAPRASRARPRVRQVGPFRCRFPGCTKEYKKTNT
jgi:hypothetical protein